MAQICPSCGQENSDGFRLCGMCGSPLAAVPAPRREERKVVTVLVAELVKFTSRAERLDLRKLEHSRHLTGGAWAPGSSATAARWRSSSATR